MESPPFYLNIKIFFSFFQNSSDSLCIFLLLVTEGNCLFNKTITKSREGESDFVLYGTDKWEWLFLLQTTAS